MRVFAGGSALSDFRLEGLLAALQACVPQVSGVSAQWTHFVDSARALDEQERVVLYRLLSYGPQRPVPVVQGALCVVIPRLGTVSPWASKATDIAHNCGLSAVNRIERGVSYHLSADVPLDCAALARLTPLLHDRMTQSVVFETQEAEQLFVRAEPAPLRRIDISADAVAAIAQVNTALGLALSADEIDYLAENYQLLGRNPADVELMMFAQANSEHCRHKIFNASWIIDAQAQDLSLFDMIRESYRHSPEGILSAYTDNSAVMEGFYATRFFADPGSAEYQTVAQDVPLLMKVETHNHPTAISPFAGAATGSGGEIRDEGATGSGSKPKAGLCGFSVSNLRIPGFEQPWEHDYGKPARIVSALDIMIEGPLGAAAFNNEFGRPNLAGYFRSFEQKTLGPAGEVVRGYHKPIMIAGGIGTIRAEHVKERPVPPGTPIVVLGGPAMLIGLGGGAASSMASGESAEDLDFASVQRGNPEIERRCQEVIDRCTAMGLQSPILAMHDVGAGGLSNAVPEIVNDAGRGGRFELRAVPNDEPGMSPLAIWCNEAQERYVLAIDVDKLELFEALCARERCPHAVLGETTEERRLVVGDAQFDNTPVDLPLEVLLGKPPKTLRDVHHQSFQKQEFDTLSLDLAQAVERVLRLPGVGSKAFLITIGDRTVSGLVTRDQMVGPWQVPVADVAVTATDYQGYTGEAMAMGERAPIALVNPAASGRMAVAEVITNIAAAAIERLSDVRLSANWMAAAGYAGEDAALYDTVKAVGEQLCPALGIAIPVGKDSLSMRTVWEQDGESREVVGPLSLVVSGFAKVQDVRRTLTPQLRRDQGDTDLILIDLGRGRQRMAGSALAQVYEQLGHHAPDLDNPPLLKAFFECIQAFNKDGMLLAYHDRSDGGLFTTLCEMAFAGHVGVTVQLGELGEDLVAALFNEELGAVIQVRHADVDTVLESLREAGLGRHSHVIGELNTQDAVIVKHGSSVRYEQTRVQLQTLWSQTSYHMQRLRDDPHCAEQEFERIADVDDPGLNTHIGFDINEDVGAPYIATGVRPRVAIVREQGVNGHIEMAAAFDRAGFTAVDVHMSDIIQGRVSLSDFKGLAACGGFSYGDVLGAGGGWAKSILFNTGARDEFERFFTREDSFGLGVCNGCQMMSQLREIIPGAAHWPQFIGNRSEQFEARLALVEIVPSPSIFFTQMQGARLPIAVAHGEGRAVFDVNPAGTVSNAGLVAMRYVDNRGHATEHYPENPNGSPAGITGLSSEDGRFTIMMPHPERMFRTVQHSWHPQGWDEDAPWMRMFRNARVWVG